MKINRRSAMLAAAGIIFRNALPKAQASPLMISGPVTVTLPAHQRGLAFIARDINGNWVKLNRGTFRAFDGKTYDVK